MAEHIDNTHWARFAALLESPREPGTPVVPASVAHRRTFRTAFDYVPSDSVLGALREWLQERGEAKAYYFLTETIPVFGDQTNFSLHVWDLNADALRELNSGVEAVLTSNGYDWALFVDCEGALHVGGPASLVERVTAALTNEDE